MPSISNYGQSVWPVLAQRPQSQPAGQWGSSSQRMHQNYWDKTLWAAYHVWPQSKSRAKYRAKAEREQARGQGFQCKSLKRAGWWLQKWKQGPGRIVQLVSVDSICQSCGFGPWWGHIQETTNDCTNMEQQIHVPLCVSFSPFLSLSKINT